MMIFDGLGKYVAYNVFIATTYGVGGSKTPLFQLIITFSGYQAPIYFRLD